MRITGQILLDGVDIYDRAMDVTEVRTRIGLLAQKPFPLPMSIYNNVAYGPRLHGMNNGRMDDLVRTYLQAVELWDEVKDRLNAPGHRVIGGAAAAVMSGAGAGRQAGCAAVRRINLLARSDLGAGGRAAAHARSKANYTIVMVTHDLAQARRLADHVVFLWLGELVEDGPASQVFEHPREERTQAYLAGQIG